jgi:methionyl-tRNA formyltransferase
MKIIYAGTPEFAVPALAALIQGGHQLVAVYTQPDRPAGRGRKLRFSPVKELAVKHNIKVVQPQSFKDDEDIQTLRSLEADLMVVAAYGIILPQRVLDAPVFGCINIHASLLPRWRGAAPIQRAILAGDAYTGVTLMQMDAGLDTGDMLATERVDIAQHTTSAELHDLLKVTGAKLLMKKLDAIENGTIETVRQDDSRACYATKLTKQEAEIDWSRPAKDLVKEIQAFNPWPVSFTSLKGENVKIWSAVSSQDAGTYDAGKVVSHTREGIQVGCGGGVLSITELQFAGKKRSRADQVLNSRNLSDECFGH